MSPCWMMHIFLLSLGGVQAQVENRVVFILGTFQNVTFSQNETVQAVVSPIPSEVSFITLQFHTRWHNATLSYTRIPQLGGSLTAADAGLLSPLRPTQNSLTWFLLSPDGAAVTGTGLILPYTSTEPVPGACNMESSLEIDPNVYLHYNLYQTVIRFAKANIGYARGVEPPACDAATGSLNQRLEYDIYQYFLPESDLSEQSLISSIQSVANVQSMRRHGKKLLTLFSDEKMTASFSSIPGQGVIFSVVVRDPLWNTSASYIPIHTYACSFTSTLDSCSTLGKISTKVFFTITGLAGLFVCFLGHRFFKCEMFCMGFGFAAFFSFILITRTTQPLDYDIRLALTAVIGVVGGVVLVTSWWRFGSVMACVIVVGLMLGFLISSTFFFTPVGDLEVFRPDVVFWITFSCIMLVVPLVFVRWPREGNITTCGFAGAYAVVLAVNAYVYTSLSYITMNILKRFLNNNFSSAFTAVPFQDIDFIMLTVWVVLGVSGVVLQLYRERARPFFPPSPYLMWLQEQERRRTNVLDPSHHTPSLSARLLARLRQISSTAPPAGEHTPLLL